MEDEETAAVVFLFFTFLHKKKNPIMNDIYSSDMISYTVMQSHYCILLHD